MFLENELDYGTAMEIPTEEYLVPIGKANVVRKGSDLTIVSHSRMVNLCANAAKELAKLGIQVELIDLRTIRPLDIATIAESVRHTNACVVVEEGHIFGGMGAEVGMQVMEHCFDYLDAPVERVCQKDTPMPYSKVLEKETMPTVERVVKAALKAKNRL